jgi:hypothetical protein
MFIRDTIILKRQDKFNLTYLEWRTALEKKEKSTTDNLI